ncbi:DUF3054 domain-containing protein [Demequina aurantiaca]|uniref:DUF3054 domain-containing protein n=1 Tax=Demequina aurantiaca TaxID=676200 RepID=UPI0007824F93|nr:DUF3054 domain-containing protein [Demequina aurantiaca]
MNLKQAARGAAALDAGAILVFAVIGRATHEEGILGGNGLGLLGTLWPFLAGAAAGWVLAKAWNKPCAWWPTGVIVWAATLGVGMLLRLVSGQGVAVSFMIVAALFLAVTLIGWRLIAGWVAKRRGLKA